MKRADLKKLIKPLVKECINEVLLEEGLLSSVISEVAKGLQGNIITEQHKQTPRPKPEPRRNNNAALLKQKDQLLDSIGRNSFNGIDIFEGTTPAPYEPSGPAGMAGPLSDQDPSDPGVDISGIVALGGSVWSQLIK
jgi:hypothetical protein